ncbi:unnamed protein product, partial [Scytosiphon promiscuus]
VGSGSASAVAECDPRGTGTGMIERLLQESQHRARRSGINPYLARRPSAHPPLHVEAPKSSESASPVAPVMKPVVVAVETPEDGETNASGKRWGVWRDAAVMPPMPVRKKSSWVSKPSPRGGDGGGGGGGGGGGSGDDGGGGGRR